MECSSPAQLGVNLEVASALRHDAVDSRQPQSGSLSLGREEWLEHAGLRFPAHTETGIAHTKHHVAPRLDGRVRQGVFVTEFDVARLDGKLSALRHGVARVDSQV